MEYIEACMALDVYNNWEASKEIDKLHKTAKLFYTDKGVLMLNRENDEPRPLSPLEYDTLSFLQRKNIENLQDTSQEEFLEKYCKI